MQDLPKLTIPVSRVLVADESIVRAVLSKLERFQLVGLDSESSGPQAPGRKMLEMASSEMTGMSIAFPDGSSFYVPVKHSSGPNLPTQLVGNLQAALCAPGITPWVHNLKHELWHSPWLDTRAKDSLLAAWILQRPGPKGGYGLKELSGADYGSFEQLANGRQAKDIPPEEMCPYACNDAFYTLKLGLELEPDIIRLGMEKAYGIELRLSRVIFDMERLGMYVDVDALRCLDEHVRKRKEALEDEWIWLHPGVSIASSKQVSRALYGGGHWDSSGVAATVHGFSTDASAVRTQLRRCPPGSVGHVSALIRAEFQDCNKILTTYSQSLIDKVGADGRLHPSFLQHGTSTGRLSCVSPNLMNIPVRSPLGQRVKAAFSAGPGSVLIAADYSQIELRVLAHHCGGALAVAYAKGEDIHAKTATLVGCTRAQAKTINFAYVYGAGVQKMADTLGVSAQDARRFMKMYRASYQEVPALREKVVSLVRGRGYAKTLLGRIRPISGINIPEGPERWHAERLAFNTPIQGGAADIMKLAMVAAHSAGLPLVCQIHDELTIEVPVARETEMATALVAAMEGAYPLKVPLVADVKVGKSWYMQ